MKKFGFWRKKHFFMWMLGITIRLVNNNFFNTSFKVIKTYFVFQEIKKKQTKKINFVNRKPSKKYKPRTLKRVSYRIINFSSWWYFSAFSTPQYHFRGYLPSEKEQAPDKKCEVVIPSNNCLYLALLPNAITITIRKEGGIWGGGSVF